MLWLYLLYFINIMTFNPTEQNIFLIIFFILAVIIVVVFIDTIKLFKKEKKVTPPLKSTPSRPYSTNELISKVSEDFKKQLEESVNKEIEKNIRELKSNFQETSEEIIKNYRNQFENGNQEVKKVISEISRQAAEETKKTSEILLEEFSQKFGEIYHLTRSALNKKTIEAGQEIENYKKEEFKKIDRKIYQILGEVAKKTIGKAVDLSDHEKLVMEALEKAKKEIF